MEEPDRETGFSPGAARAYRNVSLCYQLLSLVPLPSICNSQPLPGYVSRLSHQYNALRDAILSTLTRREDTTLSSLEQQHKRALQTLVLSLPRSSSRSLQPPLSATPALLDEYIILSTSLLHSFDVMDTLSLPEQDHSTSLSLLRCLSLPRLFSLRLSTLERAFLQDSKPLSLSLSFSSFSAAWRLDRFKLLMSFQLMFALICSRLILSLSVSRDSSSDTWHSIRSHCNYLLECLRIDPKEVEILAASIAAAHGSSPIRDDILKLLRTDLPPLLASLRQRSRHFLAFIEILRANSGDSSDNLLRAALVHATAANAEDSVRFYLSIFLQGWLHYELGEYPQAATQFLKCTSMNAFRADTSFYYIGCCYARLGFFQDAILEFQQAMTVDYRNNLGAAYNAAVIATEISDLENAQTSFIALYRELFGNNATDDIFQSVSALGTSVSPDMLSDIPPPFIPTKITPLLAPKTPRISEYTYLPLLSGDVSFDRISIPQHLLVFYIARTALELGDVWRALYLLRKLLIIVKEHEGTQRTSYYSRVFSRIPGTQHFICDRRVGVEDNEDMLPFQLELYRHYALCLVRTKQRDPAIKLLQVWLAIYPNDVFLLNYYADALLLPRDNAEMVALTEALDPLEKAIAVLKAIERFVGADKELAPTKSYVDVDMPDVFPDPNSPRKTRKRKMSSEEETARTTLSTVPRRRASRSRPIDTQDAAENDVETVTITESLTSAATKDAIIHVPVAELQEPQYEMQSFFENATFRSNTLCRLLNNTGFVLSSLDRNTDAIALFRETMIRVSDSNKLEVLSAAYNLTHVLWRLNRKIEGASHWLQFRGFDLISNKPDYYLELLSQAETKLREILAASQRGVAMDISQNATKSSEASLSLTAIIPPEDVIRMDCMCIKFWKTAILEPALRERIGQLLAP